MIMLRRLKVLTREQWWGVVVACLGWMFDTFDQRLFILARAPAMTSLLPSSAGTLATAQAGTVMTALFIAGWATGGVIFGIYGDRLGRVRTMALTIGIYSLFTGLSGLAINVWDFGLYRFLTGLGVGGEFAAGAALIAEIVPASKRPYALALMQATAMLGTLLGTVASMVVEVSARYGDIEGWRILFAIGAVPALLLILLRLRVKESEAWLMARAEASRGNLAMGGFRELFKPPLRTATIIGVPLGFAGQLGVWAIGTWTPELMRLVFAKAEKVTALEASHIMGTGMILKDLASLIGVGLFTWAAERYGRRPAFAASFISSLLAVIICFGGMREVSQIWWMMPLLGITIWSPLAGYSLYFPEIFPTRLRSSGIGLCYNIARYLTAAGVLGMAPLLATLADHGVSEPLRLTAISISSVYLIGLISLRWAPETVRRALPN